MTSIFKHERSNFSKTWTQTAYPLESDGCYLGIAGVSVLNAFRRFGFRNLLSITCWRIFAAYKSNAAGLSNISFLWTLNLSKSILPFLTAFTMPYLHQAMHPLRYLRQTAMLSVSICPAPAFQKQILTFIALIISFVPWLANVPAKFSATKW